MVRSDEQSWLTTEREKVIDHNKSLFTCHATTRHPARVLFVLGKSTELRPSGLFYVACFCCELLRTASRRDRSR